MLILSAGTACKQTAASSLLCNPCTLHLLGVFHLEKKKEKFMLFSDHNGSLLRRQPGAMTIGHSPKGKEKS